MPTTTISVETGEGTDPFNDTTYPYADKAKRVRRYIDMLRGVISGTRLSKATIRYGTAAASAVITPTGVAAADTVTVNAKVVTAAQLHARGTAIFATIVADNVLTVNGVAFTAKASASGANQFALGANDTAAVTNAVAKINSHPDLQGVVTAVADTAGGDKTVKLRAVNAGTAGNAITLAKTGAPITVSAATLENGAAASGDQFDYGDTDAQAGASLASAIANSSTAGLAGIVTASATSAGVVTVSAAKKGLIGNAITVATSNGTRLPITGGVSRLAGGTETAVVY